MKTIYLIILLCAFSTISLAQQQVKKDTNGDYTVVYTTKAKKCNYKPTGKYVNTKDGRFPIYNSIRILTLKDGRIIEVTTNKYFYFRTSKKTGNVYRSYINILDIED